LGLALAALFSPSCRLAETRPGDDPSPGASFDAPVPEALALPWAEVEAESGTGGTVVPPSRALHTPAAEASGRQYVHLVPGQSLTLAAPVAGSSLVVRYSLPDTADGQGQDGTLEVSLAEAPAPALALTSRLSWDYGTPAWGSSSVWSAGPPSLPRHFWDEARLRTPPYPAGARLTLTNPASASTPVDVDLVDFELVPPAVPGPAGSLNFADYHPAADGVTDDTSRLQQALGDAQGKTLFVPEGTYRIGSVTVGSARVQGAGLWRTWFVGPWCQFRFSGQTTRLSDFALFGQTRVRNDVSDAENGLAGSPGPGSVVERLWIEHKKCAFWVGLWNSRPGVNHLRITEGRFRNLMADGVNLCSGTTQTTVDNCRVRSSGDDGLAAWSPTAGGASGGGNTFAHNLVQLPWVASGISLYGGGPFRVVGNTVADTVTTGSGLFVASAFDSWPFVGPTTFEDNNLVRCGALESDWGGTTGALRFLAAQANLTPGTFVVLRTRVEAPTAAAVSVQGPESVGALTLAGLTVVDLGDLPVAIAKPNARGSARFTGLDGVASSPDRWIDSSPSFSWEHP